MNVLQFSSNFVCSGFPCLHTWELCRESSFIFSPKICLFPGLPQTSVSDCDDAPVPHTSRTQLFTALVFQIGEFPLLLSLTAGVMGIWEHMLSKESIFTTGSAAAGHPLYL